MNIRCAGFPAAALLAAAALAPLACVAPRPSSHGAARRVALKPGRWDPTVRRALEEAIADRAGRGGAAVFDFDNTLACRDIGEAVFGVLLEEGKLAPAARLRPVCPPLAVAGTTVAVQTAADLPAYYEAALAATDRDGTDPAPYAEGYAWLTRILAGLGPDDVVAATERAFAGGAGARDAADPALPETKAGGFRRPFLHPEMVDLCGVLLREGFDVRVVSASNVWSVRWMVTKALNPALRERFGPDLAVAPGNVVGVSVLLRDTATGLLHKDAVLVRTDPAYAALEPGALARYELTDVLAHPLTGYTGKVAAIVGAVGYDRPFLAAGDSPNDHAMLDWAENRLWLARLEKGGYQEKTLARATASPKGTWWFQPVLTKKGPGFVPSREDLARRLAARPAERDAAFEALEGLPASRCVRCGDGG